MAYQHTTSMLLLFTLLGICVVTVSAANNDSSAHLAERRLRQTLLNSGGYDAKERPAQMSNQTVNVNISLVMYALISLNEKEQVLKGASWIIMGWYDYRIHWEPEAYGNMRYLSLGMDEIWTPKILLMNTVSEKVENPIQESVFRALVSWQGAVTLEGPIIHETSCEMQLSKFPFDRQNCLLVFHTQNIPNCIMNLTEGPKTRFEREQATSQAQWLPLNLTVKTSVVKFSYKAFSEVTFYLAAERIPDHYLLNIALPSAILTFISLGVFWLTPESGERISTAVSLLLGQAVFWLIVADSLPPSGAQGTPLLLDCIEYNFAVGGLAVLLSVVTVSLQHQPGPLRGRFLRKLVLQVLPLVVCLRPGGDTGRGNARGEQPKMELDTVKVVSLSGKGSPVIKKTKDSNVDDSLKGNGSDEMKLTAAILDRVFFVIATIIFIGGNVEMVACIFKLI